MINTTPFPKPCGKPVKHTCSVCRNKGAWQKGWGWLFMLIGCGVAGYEITWKTCSDACRKKDKDEKLYQKEKDRLNEIFLDSHPYEKKNLKELVQ